MRALHHFEGFRASRETLLSCGIALSSEVDTGSREENASKQESKIPVLITSEPEFQNRNILNTPRPAKPTTIK
jgi:hypothetical protein